MSIADMKRCWMIAAALLLPVCMSESVVAQTQGAERRVALVIGNSAYKEAALKNPVNDARLMAAKLKELGFDVIVRENATLGQIASAVAEFAGRLTPDTAALIYYAGHGVQSRGRNYLIPVDAAPNNETELGFQAVDVSRLTEELDRAQARVSFLILDACRNNPFERRLRGAARGLAAVDAARGALIAYATAPGSVAADGDGMNGPYTEELVKALSVPNLKAEEVFKRVTAAVEERTKAQQTPWISSSLRGDFVFYEIANTPSIAAPSGIADRDALFWQSIQSSQRARDFEAYLSQFPEGTFAFLARNRIEILKNPQLAAAPAIKPPAVRPEVVLEPIDREFIAKEPARVRETPDLGARVVATLKEGDPVQVLGKVRDQNWYRIERAGKPLGFVATSLLEEAAVFKKRKVDEERQQLQAAAAAAPKSSSPSTPAAAPAAPKPKIALLFDGQWRGSFKRLSTPGFHNCRSSTSEFLVKDGRVVGGTINFDDGRKFDMQGSRYGHAKYEGGIAVDGTIAMKMRIYDNLGTNFMNVRYAGRAERDKAEGKWQDDFGTCNGVFELKRIG